MALIVAIVQKSSDNSRVTQIYNCNNSLTVYYLVILEFFWVMWTIDVERVSKECRSLLSFCFLLLFFFQVGKYDN